MDEKKKEVEVEDEEDIELREKSKDCNYESEGINRAITKHIYVRLFFRVSLYYSPSSSSYSSCVILNVFRMDIQLFSDSQSY